VVFPDINGDQSFMEEMPKVLLKLYISGTTSRTEKSLLNLRRKLAEQYDTRYELDVCDVTENPQAAENDKILATPTLVLISPPPARRIVGDFADAEKIVLYLGLSVPTVTPGDTHG
jgi:circadian clock protein KaiB